MLPIQPQEAAPINPVLTPVEHNNADDSALTRGIAGVWNKLAAPLVEHVYGPLTEQNHMAGVVAVNATLTAPRIAEIPLARSYVRNVEAGRFGRALAALTGKMVLKFSDGLDGPVARGTGATTEFGAAFDPAVDLLGSASDVWAIKKLAKKEKDTTIDRLMDVSTAIDVAAVAVGGLGNGIAAKYAKSKGVELESTEEARSIAMGKLKYGLKGAGNSALELRGAVQNHTARRVLRHTGIAFNAASIATGLISIGQYGASAVSKIRKVRQANAAK